MKIPNNYNETQTNSKYPVKPTKSGKYNLIIVNIKETKTRDLSKDMIVFDFDIYDGPSKQYYTNIYQGFEMDKWPLRLYQSITNDNINYYAGIIKAIKNSNDNFPQNFEKMVNGEIIHDTSLLIGKKVGGFLDYEEYKKNNGTVGTVLKVKYLCSIKDINENVGKNKQSNNDNPLSWLEK